MPYQPSLPGLFAPCAPARVSNLFDTLLHYPDISAELTCARAKELGQSAELLTDSLLARLGIPCANFAEHSPFDRMIWIGSACFAVADQKVVTKPAKADIGSRSRRDTSAARTGRGPTAVTNLTCWPWLHCQRTS